jgi:hypothetical protein
MSGHRQLRELIGAAVEGKTATDQPDLVAAVKKEIVHGVVQSPAAAESRWPSNCVSYAVGLSNLTDYWDLITDASLVPMPAGHAGIPFLKRLVDQHLAEVASPSVGDLVIYFEEAEPKHIGISIGNDRVRSKWGTGLLWDHGTWEVPTYYGATARYFAPLTEEEAWEAFCDYLKSQPLVGELHRQYGWDI